VVDAPVIQAERVVPNWDVAIVPLVAEVETERAGGATQFRPEVAAAAERPDGLAVIGDVDVDGAKVDRYLRCRR
jgi:hypothetical protein